MYDFLAVKFPGEIAVYWIQHITIFFIVPPFLIHSWGGFFFLINGQL